MVTNIKQQRLNALQRQIARVERREQRLQNLSRRYARWRMGLVLGGFLTALLAERLLGGGLGWGTAVVFALAFIWVATYHGRVKTSITRYAQWRHIKQTHVARMTHDWPHIPQPLAAATEPGHPFEADLNLTGMHSLYQLLDTTMSLGGSLRLYDWLREPLLDAEQIHARQAIIRELVPLVRFRDRLALAGAAVARDQEARWEDDKVIRWLRQQTAQASLLPWIIGLGGLAGLNLTLMVLHALALLPPWWMASLLLYLVISTYKHRDTRDLFAHAYRLEKTLNHFRAVLLYLEKFPYDHTPHLAQLCAPFRDTENPPSTSLRQIVRIAGAAGAQQSNLLGFLVNTVVPWDLYFAHRLNQYKQALRLKLTLWIDTWYELEALNALAHFGYLHPHAVFPEVLPSTTETDHPLLHARALGHPLLPDDGRVSNDFTLEHCGAIALVTGSNMSGKSTFLRTLGLNLCLAYAGAPVMATALQLVPLRIFTCINISDSVTDGISFFYAEVRRLKALLNALEASHPAPLLFLIDEIFRGTNNRERLIGSRAYIQALTGGHGIGVISTHDLELVTLADEVTDIRNHHFREEVHDGRMVFDYQLHPGPCPTTNALTIMQMEGLPVAILDMEHSHANGDAHA